MKLGKVSPLNKALFHTFILSLSFVLASQVTLHAATTVTFGDNTGDDKGLASLITISGAGQISCQESWLLLLRPPAHSSVLRASVPVSRPTW